MLPPLLIVIAKVVGAFLLISTEVAYCSVDTHQGCMKFNRKIMHFLRFASPIEPPQQS
jgi:hypothetical protein